MRFKLYEPGHVDALDLVLTPAIAYGWYRLFCWWGGPFFWLWFALFVIGTVTAYRKSRAEGKCRWPWEDRP